VLHVGKTTRVEKLTVLNETLRAVLSFCFLLLLRLSLYVRSLSEILFLITVLAVSAQSREQAPKRTNKTNERIERAYSRRRACCGTFILFIFLILALKIMYIFVKVVLNTMKQPQGPKVPPPPPPRRTGTKDGQWMNRNAHRKNSRPRNVGDSHVRAPHLNQR